MTYARTTPIRPSRRDILRSTALAGAALLLTTTALPQPAAAQTLTPPETDVSAEMPYAKKTIDVLGHEMAYVDEGDGPVVLFLHGNPTSSYLWRNVIPHVLDRHRAIAPDLIGFGDSAKPDIDYSWADHQAHLDAFIEALGLEDMVLVLHDWGSILGFSYARRHPGDVRAVAFMEAGLPPALPVPSLEAMGPDNAQLFAMMRGPQGEAALLEQNFFVEEILGKLGVARPLPDEVMENYRAPFPTPGSRRPILAFPRQVPIAGDPADVAAEVAAYGEWLYETEIPKLMFWATPGAFMPEPVVDYIRANASNVTEVFLGEGRHYLQEDHPTAIGEALASWLNGVDG